MKTHMPKLILGFVGEMSSGKGTAVKYLHEKYNAQTYRFSTMLRDVLDRLYLPHTRDNMIDLSIWIRQRFGEDTMAKVMAKDIEKSNANFIAVDGIRRIADIEYLKKNPGFHLIEIVAEPRVRFERLKARRENTDDAKKTWQQFQDDASKETEKSIRKIAIEAEDKVDNNKNLEELYRQLDGLVEQYQMTKSRCQINVKIQN